MANIESFESKVPEIIDRINNGAFRSRWEEAISFGLGLEADAYWFRESEEVVNIVWLNADGIRDITFIPEGGETMFNFVPIKNIRTIEVREGDGVTDAFRLGVSGTFLVHLIITSQSGNLYWIAESGENTDRLREFVIKVLGSYADAI